jgi:rhamnose transport system ATP-binding protein
VIVLDEPTSSLSIAEVDRLLAIVRGLAAQGITVIYVSHRMGEIFAACDRVTVLRDGRYIATSRVKEIDEPTLVEQMIGRRLSGPTRRAAQPAQGEGEAAALRSLAGPAGEAAAPALAPPPPAARDEAPLLELKHLSSPGRISDISLRLRAGEVLGIGGLVGSGRSELLDAIFGLDPRAAGQVLMSGIPQPRGKPRAAIQAGMGYVPEDRKLQGLFFQLSVSENIVAPIMRRLAKLLGFRSLRAERQHVTNRLKAFQIKAASPASLPGELSGGNQQKLLIARWMGEGTRVLLLDEPTRGIDVGTKAEIYRLIRHAADGGAGVLLVSSEMPELLALSDRIIVLCQGYATGELTGDEMTQANILRLATREQVAPAAVA